MHFSQEDTLSTELGRCIFGLHSCCNQNRLCRHSNLVQLDAFKQFGVESRIRRDGFQEVFGRKREFFGGIKFLGRQFCGIAGIGVVLGMPRGGRPRATESASIFRIWLRLLLLPPRGNPSAFRFRVVVVVPFNLPSFLPSKV